MQQLQGVINVPGFFSFCTSVLSLWLCCLMLSGWLPYSSLLFVKQVGKKKKEREVGKKGEQRKKKGM